MDVHPRRLRLLRDLAALGTVTAVAERLGYTPSAVSQQLSVLEREVGTSLLERRGRGVELTAAGRALVAETDGVFDALERATAAATQAADELAGPVDVGSIASAGATLVPRALEFLRAGTPQLTVRFHHLDDRGIDELRRGGLDVWVAQRYSILPTREEARLEVRTVFREPVGLAVPAVRDAGPELMRYRDLPWVGGPPGSACAELLARLSEGAGIVPDVRHRSEDPAVMMRLVAADLAVAVLPWLATDRVPDGVVIHPLADVERRLDAFVRGPAAIRPAIAAVLDALEVAGSELAQRIGTVGARAS